MILFVNMIISITYFCRIKKGIDAETGRISKFCIEKKTFFNFEPEAKSTCKGTGGRYGLNQFWLMGLVVGFVWAG